MRSIQFEGNGHSLQGTSDYNIRTAMYQGQNPPLTWLLRPRQRRVYLDRQELMTDAWRIETWYAHRGYLDARFLGWELEDVRRPISFGPWNAPGQVRITGHIDEGPMSRVRQIFWDGLDMPGADVLIRILSRDIPFREGERFDLSYIETSEMEILRELQERSYALASVKLSVEAHPDQEAVDIRVWTRPGSQCVFGPIDLQGNIPTSMERIWDAITIEEGEAFDSRQLSVTQKSLFSLGIFSVVDIVPMLDEVEDGIVPVSISLSETGSREVRLGGGIGWESGKEELHISAGMMHRNLFGRLIRLDIDNEVGFASLSRFGDLDFSGEETDTKFGRQVVDMLVDTAEPIVDSTATLVVPDVVFNRLDVEQMLSYEVGIEPGYRYTSREFSPGIRYRAASWGRMDVLDLGLNYRLERFDFLDPPASCTELDDISFELDCTDQYLLSSLHQELEMDSRNDLLFTRYGTYGTYTLTEAGGPFGGRYSFVRFTFDQRGFVSLLGLRDDWGRRIRRMSGSDARTVRRDRSDFSRWVGENLLSTGALAGRMAGGLILPYGDDDRAGVPYAERFTLGGSTTVRGWSLGHLGPYIYVTPDGLDGSSVPGVTQQSTDIVPAGGLVSLYGSAELRLYALDDYGLVLFTDMGNVWNRWEDLSDFSLLPSVGVGLRYVTSIGPLRVDLARRMDEDPMYALENRWALHLSFSEAY